MFQDFVQQPNVPGLRRIVLLPDHQMAANGQVVAEPTVLEFYFPTTRGSLSVSDAGLTPFGKLYGSTVSVTIPRAIADIQNFLTAHQYRRYVVYVQDANDRVHRIGGGGDGATVSISYSIDPSLAGTTITISHSSPIALPYGAGGLVGQATGPGIIDSLAIEDILYSSTDTVIEQLSMTSALPGWAHALLITRTSVAIEDLTDGDTVTHNLGGYVLTRFVDTDGNIDGGVYGEKITGNLNAVTFRSPVLEGITGQLYNGYLLCEKYS